jgi:hypothetical protein
MRTLVHIFRLRLFQFNVDNVENTSDYITKTEGIQIIIIDLKITKFVVTDNDIFNEDIHTYTLIKLMFLMNIENKKRKKRRCIFKKDTHPK